jgi:hypothetical protein
MAERSSDAIYDVSDDDPAQVDAEDQAVPEDPEAVHNLCVGAGSTADGRELVELLTLRALAKVVDEELCPDPDLDDIGIRRPSWSA